MGSALSLRDELRSGRKKLGIWGLGYIGYSAAAYFAKAGVACIGTDVLEERVNDINNAKETIPGLELWLGFEIKSLTKAGLIKATLDWKELVREDVPVHLVAVPTEEEGMPYSDILKDVISKICHFKDVKMSRPPLVIIESTLTPNMLDNEILPIIEKSGLKPGKDILVGVAPRRDWFISPEKTVVTLPRVIGGTTPETTELMAGVLGIVSKSIFKAEDHRHAELVKSVENAFRQVSITLANQLSLAYPDVDIAEVLRLAGTKWNIDTYRPSFGTGGYCIPVAPLYVLDGATKPEELSILKESTKTDKSQPIRVAEKVIRSGAKKVGVLGVSYKGDIEVHTLSPALTIVKTLQKNGIQVKVYDPFYPTEQWLKERTGLDVEVFDFPEGLREFDTVLIIAAHSVFRFTNTSKIKGNLINCKLILDNTGIWKDLNFDGNIKYFMAGDKGWLQ